MMLLRHAALGLVIYVLLDAVFGLGWMVGLAGAAIVLGLGINEMRKDGRRRQSPDKR